MCLQPHSKKNKKKEFELELELEFEFEFEFEFESKLFLKACGRLAPTVCRGWTQTRVLKMMACGRLASTGVPKLSLNSGARRQDFQALKIVKSTYFLDCMNKSISK